MSARFRTPYVLLVYGSLALCAGIAFAGTIRRAVVVRVPPTYPELAHRMHVEGKVLLLVGVKADGTVSNTKVESGHTLLLAAAQDAVRHWRFAPYTEASETEVEVNFTMAQ